MKVVHIISSLVKGGGERVTVELANKSIENGDDITFVVGWPLAPNLTQNNINPKINVEFISTKKLIAYLKIIPWIIKNWKWINTNDVIHCHLTYGGVFGAIINLLYSLFSKNKKFIIVETYHAVGMHIPKFNRWFHSKMMLFKNGVVFMARDFYWDEFTQKHKNLKSIIIPNGISLQNIKKDDNEKNEFVKNLSIPKCKHLIGTVGMLRPERRPDFYVTMFKLIKEMFKDDDGIHFILGGDGTEYEKIENLRIKDKLEDSFHMIGLISDNPCNVISKLDVYISVSVGNTTGVSMIEAAMCKVPVIGIQLLENYKATEKDWVWSHTDLNKVAERAVFLIDNKKERQKVIDQQYNYVVNNLTSDAMYSSYNLFYKEVRKSNLLN